MALLALSDGAWAFLGIIATGLFGIAVELLRRTYKGVRQINNAVNHVPEGTPTLVQRVERLERRSDAQGRWLVDVLKILADQLGVKLPPYPKEEDKAA